MTSCQVNRAIARITGETIATIKQRGFSLLRLRKLRRRSTPRWCGGIEQPSATKR